MDILAAMSVFSASFSIHQDKTEKRPCILKFGVTPPEGYCLWGYLFVRLRQTRSIGRMPDVENRTKTVLQASLTSASVQFSPHLELLRHLPVKIAARWGGCPPTTTFSYAQHSECADLSELLRIVTYFQEEMGFFT